MSTTFTLSSHTLTCDSFFLLRATLFPLSASHRCEGVDNASQKEIATTGRRT
jgi:hypothetical protein